MNKKLFLLGLVGAFALALAACKEKTKEENIKVTIPKETAVVEEIKEAKEEPAEPEVEGFSVKGEEVEDLPSIEEEPQKEPEEKEKLTFPNEAVLKEVRKAAEIPEGPIYAEDVADITELYLNGMNLTDISFLASFTSLADLDISENAIKDLTALSGLNELKALFADDNKISDLTPLKGHSKLEILCIDANKVTDLAPLSGLKKLNGLYAADNKITDLTPCLDMPSLEELDVSGNKISKEDVKKIEEKNIAIIYKKSE